MNNSKFLVIGSTDKQIGKTIFAVGLAEILLSKGYKVGYFKPVGQRVTTTERGEYFEEDACSVKEKLNLPDSIEDISPFLYHHEFLHKLLVEDKVNEIVEKIKGKAEKISRGKDLILVEGLDYAWTGLSVNLSALNMAKALDSPLIMLMQYDQIHIFDKIKLTNELIEKMEIKYLGAIIIGARAEKDLHFREYTLLELEAQKAPILGILPSIREVIPITPKEIIEVTDSKVLVGENWLNKSIENFLIGAMTPEKAMRYLRITANKAVVTGGDRTDILLAALETPTSALILTGNIYPDNHVLLKAEEMKVPVLLSPYDTYTTIRRIEDFGYSVRHMEKEKIENLAEEIGKRVNIDKILEDLGIG